MAIILERKVYRASVTLAYGSFAVCPFCAISSIPYGLVSTSLITTNLSPGVLNFFVSLYGLITVSLIGQLSLLFSIVVISRKMGKIGTVTARVNFSLK